MSKKGSGPKLAGRSAAEYTSHGIGDAEKLSLLADLEQSGLGWFWATDMDGNLSYLSDAFCERIGCDFDQVAGKPLSELFAIRSDGDRTQSLALKLGMRKSFASLAASPIAGNAEVVVSLSGRPSNAASGDFAGYRGTANDITNQFQREEETERLAKFDSLTGLANRHQMARSIDATLTAFRAAKRNCAIMMLDLDKFKQVNDTLGHAAGDELLKEAANRLKRAAGSDAEVARLGGDEFQIMLPDMDDRGELGEIAKRIITMLSQPYSLEDGRCVIGASVGIAIAPHDGVSRDEINKSADMALYAAKNGGRGQFRFYSGDLANEALFRRRLEEDLADAVRSEQLFLRYQPIVSLSNHLVETLEAQICWQHPKRGVIDHDEFHEIVENSAMALEVGEWAIGRACEDARDWPESLRVAVNVPTKQFSGEGFSQKVEAALDAAGLNHKRLELEVNEAVFEGETNATDKTLGELFKLGVKLTLDEFGTGHSSLGYLRRAPFDAIKITPEFYQTDGEGSDQDMPLIAAVVTLSKALGMEIVAAGVETMELHDALHKSGVSNVQGPIFAESVPVEQIEAEIAKGGWMIEPVASRTARARRRTVYRKIQIIHDDHSYDVTLRNLSKTGALIEGIEDVPVQTQFVVDLGGGQLAVATVSRSNGDIQGLEFEDNLVDDGAGGLCTRNRVSPYALAAAGAPLEALSDGDYKGMKGGMLDPSQSVPKFAYSGNSLT
ncbi:MAG: EAL domain-containing protein [Erythrobacter sp.]